MRNSNVFQNAGLLALVLAGSTLAAPIPASYLGLGQTVTVTSSAQAILTGGSFNANVGTPAISTILWCVDLENTIAPGSSSATYPANIILVSDTTAQAGKVQKGLTPSNPSGWEDGESFTAQQRYNAAGFLVEKIIANGGGYSYNDLQRAIWRLTDLTAGTDTDNTALWENGAYVAATTFIANGGKTARTWATVSGAAPNGVLDSNNRRQTFLVEVAPVPEPATYALMGGGLLLLASLRRRRAK